MGPREILNKQKWHPQKTLEKTKIIIKHRGAPKNKLKIKGNQIKNLGKGFMTIKKSKKPTKIPYHRITKIKTNKKTIWKKNKKT